MAAKIEFKRWENVPEVVNVTEEICKLAGKYLQYASSNKSEDKSQARKTWGQLSDKYWDLLFAILDAQTESFPSELVFDDQERLFINFGFLNDEITPRNKNFDAALALGSKFSLGVFGYRAFSDFIADCWGMITGNPLPTSPSGVKTEEKLKILDERLLSLQEQRNSELLKIISRSKNMTGGDVESLVSDMSKTLISATKVTMRNKEYREAKEDVKQAMSQNRFRYNEAERIMETQLSIAQKDEEDPLGLPELEVFTALHESTKILARKIIYCQQESDKLRRRAEKITQGCVQFSQQMMRKELKNMLVKKKEYMAVPAKAARCEQSLLCPQDAEPVLYAAASRAIEEMSDLDMNMFAVPRIRMYGIPQVIFIPGQGFGTYDWADHTILLPVFPTTSAEKAIAYGVGTFRWDSDEDRVLKNAYETIKDNKGKSILEMATSFYKDYFLWITKEKKGYRILPRDTHKTFLQMFAPRKQED
ncbi:MAG: hypothetical protein LBP21_03600 [Synergistaceae bacterium]|jgi:hypothetical protein|nr:hypothetical protein [Synergistaceae bacterium]